MNNDTLNELCEGLEKAYNLLSSVFVNGENVDKVAIVRQYLRDAYQLVKKLEDSAADKSAEGEASDG